MTSHPLIEWTIRKLSQGVDTPPKPCYSYLISQAKATTDNQSKLLLITMEYIKLPSVTVAPEVSWFDKLTLPVGKSYVVKERQLLCLDNISNIVDGYEDNIARAAGTDNNNKNALKDNIFVNGVLVSVQPPYVFAGSLSLIDGYTRYQALLELGITHWVFNIVEVKEGYTEQQVRDEIGLGANNHPPSKAATQDDFKKRLASWVSNFKSDSGELPSLGNCIDWVNSIPHSLTQKQVTDISEKVLNSSLCASTVASYDASKVQRFVQQNVDQNAEVIAYNASGNSTYVRRAVMSAFESLEKDQLPEIVGYTQNVLAEDIGKVRKSAQKHVDRYNDLFEKAFQLRLKHGADFKLFSLKGFVPQVIGEEEADTLVMLD